MKRKREQEENDDKVSKDGASDFKMATDCLRHCFSFLDMRDMPILAAVCKDWNCILKSTQTDLHLCSTDAPRLMFMNVKPLCAKAYAAFRNSYPRIRCHSVFLTGHPRLFCVAQKLPHNRVAFVSKRNMNEKEEDVCYLQPFATCNKSIISCLEIRNEVVCDDVLYSVTTLSWAWRGPAPASLFFAQCPNLRHLYLRHFGGQRLEPLLVALSSPCFTDNLQSLHVKGRDFSSLTIPRQWSAATFKGLKKFDSGPGLIPFPNVSNQIDVAKYGPIKDWKHDVFGDHNLFIQNLRLELGANVPFCRHFLPKKSSDLCRLDLVFQSIHCIEFKLSVQKLFDDFAKLTCVIIQVGASDKWPLTTGVLENKQSVGIRGRGVLPLMAIPPFLAPCFHGSVIVDGCDQLTFLTESGIKPSEVIVTSKYNVPQALPNSVKNMWLLDGAVGLADLWKRELRDLGVSLVVGCDKKKIL